MKKTIKKTASKPKFTPIKPVIEVDITKVNTYDDLVKEMTIGKINAGYDISVGEFANLMEHESNCATELINDIMELNATEISKLVVKNIQLQNDLKWATRPWYKKLMFWKKNPNK